MSQQSLADLLGGILDTYGDRIEAVKEGRAPESDWDGPPLPLNLEYRVEVDSSVVSPSKASGKDQFVITYVIQEPKEFAGRKVQGYYAKDSPNEWARKALADLFGALKADMQGWGEDIDGFAAQFVGRTAVIAVDSFGDDNDRFNVRWVNSDRGQTLKTDIKPKAKKSGGDANLKADIVIPKDKAEQTAQAPAPVAPPLPGGDSKPAGGPNLPPGLR